MYGYSEGKPTLEACEAITGHRCIVVSRSTFPGVQKSIGHWLGKYYRLLEIILHNQFL